MSLDKEKSGDSAASNDTCHVFVSRRKEEGTIIERDSEIRGRLSELGNDRLTFWDMSDITSGEDWPEVIYQKLETTNILLIILTRAALKDFIWPTFEIGCFYGLHGRPQNKKEKRKIVCIYADGESVPDPLRNFQGVPANQRSVEKLLWQLYKDKDFTCTDKPINAKVTGGSIKSIAESICTGINRGDGNEVKDCKRMNPRIHVMLDESMVKRIKTPGPEDSLKGIFEGAKISSDFRNDGRLQQIFRRNLRTWGCLKETSALNSDPAEFNQHWMREIESIVKGFLCGKAGQVGQVYGVYIAQSDDDRRNRKAWQPELDKILRYGDGHAEFVVAFSPRPHQTWWMRQVAELQVNNEQQAQISLVANLVIGSRIRQEVIEESEKLFRNWQANGEHNLKNDFAHIKQRFEGVKRDGFVVKDLTRDSLGQAFKNESDGEEFRKIEEEYRDEIDKLLRDALSSESVKNLKCAVEKWRANNAKFLRLAAKCYSPISEGNLYQRRNQVFL